MFPTYTSLGNTGTLRKAGYTLGLWSSWPAYKEASTLLSGFSHQATISEW